MSGGKPEKKKFIVLPSGSSNTGIHNFLQDTYLDVLHYFIKITNG